MIVDVAAFVGEYPYRQTPWSDTQSLMTAMDDVSISMAWVGSAASILHNDPRPANLRLLREVYAHRKRLVPVPTVQADQPRWETDLDLARNASAPAVRSFPMHGAVDPAGTDMRRLCAECGHQGMGVQLFVKLEDVRQRVPADATPDLPPAAVRTLARSSEAVRLVISNASRAFVEEVHFGLTETEARRIVWDINGLWGPPADDLTLLAETVGVERFVFGSMAPLRMPEAPVAKLDLAGLDESRRAAVEYGNLSVWQSREH